MGKIPMGLCQLMMHHLDHFNPGCKGNSQNSEILDLIALHMLNTPLWMQIHYTLSIDTIP